MTIRSFFVVINLAKITILDRDNSSNFKPSLTYMLKLTSYKSADYRPACRNHAYRFRAEPGRNNQQAH
jgi:hypothetical protein